MLCLLAPLAVRLRRASPAEWPLPSRSPQVGSYFYLGSREQYLKSHFKNNVHKPLDNLNSVLKSCARGLAAARLALLDAMRRSTQCMCSALYKGPLLHALPPPALGKAPRRKKRCPMAGTRF